MVNPIKKTIREMKREQEKMSKKKNLFQSLVTINPKAFSILYHARLLKEARGNKKKEILIFSFSNIFYFFFSYSKRNFFKF